MQGQFVIPVRDLEAGPREYSFPLTPAWLREALQGCELDAMPGTGEGTLAVRASPTGGNVLVEGTVGVSLVGGCVRCLEPAPLRVDAGFEVLMVPRAKAAQREDDDETDWEAYDGEHLVLDPLCREQILLAVPMNPLCRPECPGIPYEGSTTGPRN